MKLRLILLATLALFLGLWSCTDFHKKDRVGKIDKLSADLSEMSEALTTKNLDTLEMRDLLDTLFYGVYQIEDTVSLGFAYKIDSLRKWNERFEERNAILNKLKVDIPESLLRLAALKKDVQNDFGKRDKYDSYIHNEALSRDNLELFVNRFNELQSDLEDDFAEFGRRFKSELNERSKKEQ